MKFILAVLIVILSTNITFAQNLSEDCACKAPSYVVFELMTRAEVDDFPWEVISAQNKIEMRDDLEPELCFVKLSVSTLNYDGEDVPDGEFAIFDGLRWNLASDLEAQLEETGCQLLPNV